MVFILSQTISVSFYCKAFVPLPQYPQTEKRGAQGVPPCAALRQYMPLLLI